MKKFEDFIKKFYSEFWPNQPKQIREGQALMIFLNTFDPEEYKRLSSIHYYEETDIDCFYNNKLIGNTLLHLQKVWNYQKSPQLGQLPCNPDHNGECLVCDCWVGRCEWKRLWNNFNSKNWDEGNSLDQVIELFKNHLTDDQIKQLKENEWK